MIIRYKNRFNQLSEYNGPVILITEDLHNEQAAYFRAYYADDVTSGTMVTMHGYAGVNGSFRTIKAALADASRFDPSTPIYRSFRFKHNKVRLLSMGNHS